MSTMLFRTLVCGAVFGALTVAPPLRAAPGPVHGPTRVEELSAPPLPHYDSSWDEFQALKAAAHGGTKATWKNLPDWTGIYARPLERIGIKFDPKQKSQAETTATPTPENQKRIDKKIADHDKGIEWDQLSFCLPSGYPRWLAEPFLREFVLRPEEAWLINEQLNEIRRIYTDGRGHVAAADAYPLWEGDSIGFWNGDTLVIHTNSLKSGQYQRLQPDYSEQVSTVEQWRRVSPELMQVIVDIYDPVALTKPWRVVQGYERVKTPDLRINYWSCEENNNIVQSPEGGTQFVLPGDKGYKDPATLQAQPSKAPAESGK
jgi:hypothetical protein